ncbi:MAG: DUF2474 domain-containing protein [Beijerinckiaceae bacterium]|jgi:hypothetical protein|nr:DUF2474 domain-containing protein [Beijerinckiaceae bacterium]
MRMQQFLWFAALWLGGVAVLAAVAFVLRLAIKAVV